MSENAHDERGAEGNKELGAKADVGKQQPDDEAVEVAEEHALYKAMQASQGEGKQGAEEVRDDIDGES